MAGVDFSTAWQTVEGLETVTYFQKATETTFSPPGGTVMTHAKRRAPTKKDDLGPAGALLAGVELVWHLWVIDLGSIVPKVADVILDSTATRWTVIEVEIQNQTKRYRLKTYRER